MLVTIYARIPNAILLLVLFSAGVGRTGAWIVLDAQLDRLLSGVRSIDVYCQVTCLRAQRNYMVQTQDQYVFCYDALQEITQSGFPGD